MQRIRKGDLVQVVTGQDKGKQGKVLKVLPDQRKAIVEGVRLVKRHQKATQQGGPAGIVEKALPIDMSNIMPVDPKTRKTSRVGFKVEAGDKKSKLRICKTSGEPVENVAAQG